jgi:Tfp pilus assembly protein FimT
MIIALTTSLAAPSLGGWSDGARMRNACDDFLSTVRLARGQSILTATEYVLMIDRTTNTYALSTRAGNTLSPAPGDWGTAVELPNGFRLDIVSGGEGSASIVFYPDGRATPALVRIVSARGTAREIASNAPAEPFAIVGGAS